MSQLRVIAHVHERFDMYIKSIIHIYKCEIITNIYIYTYIHLGCDCYNREILAFFAMQICYIHLQVNILFSYTFRSHDLVSACISAGQCMCIMQAKERLTSYNCSLTYKSRLKFLPLVLYLKTYPKLGLQSPLS